MTSESPAKIKCKGINQIAIVVENLEVVAENYWNILGIGPWAIFKWQAPLVYDRKYHGKTVWAREQRGAYNYFDIKPLRATWEPVHYEEIGAGPTMFP